MDELIQHAFISYDEKDVRRADVVQTALEAAGIRVWRAAAEVMPGDSWRDRIRGAISADALVFLACFSRDSPARVRSRQYEELTWAVAELRQRHPAVPWLIPVRFDDCGIPDLDLGVGADPPAAAQVESDRASLKREGKCLPRRSAQH